jgi:predicted 3-demethylubiquinone-9 3-methyltransferase (glyoxalase superfamily)
MEERHMPTPAKVCTCLWFEKEGLAAARFYTSLLPNSAIRDEQKFDNMATGEQGGVQVIDFTLAGTPFQILEAGPHQQHNDMASISVTTDDQAETDRLWAALTADGGREVQCGWLRDRWGIAWQIVPRRLNELVTSGNGAQAKAVMAAMMGMIKLDIAGLEAAYDAA